MRLSILSLRGIFSSITLIALLSFVLFLSSCQSVTDNPFTPVSDVQEFEADGATAWMDVIMSAVRTTPGFTPPVAARAYGYAGITMWESVVNGTANGSSLSGQINSLAEMPTPESGKRYHWVVVMNAAMAEYARSFFPTATDSMKQVITATETRIYNERRDMGIGADILERSVEYGRFVARTVFQYSKSDGGHEGYTRNFPSSYVVPRGNGMWIPTPPAFQAIPLQPYWGKNRPFLLPMGNVLSVCDPGSHPTFSTDSTSPMYKSAYEVYQTVKNISPEQKEIALFWADDPVKTATPPGHSISILNQIVRERGSRLGEAAKAYAMLGIAVNEAFIACWEIKYKYNLIRPLSYIQLYIDSTWNKSRVTDPLTTPPFPEYTSGHSVQAAASFEILKHLYGNNTSFWDKTHTFRGMKARYFNSFEEAKQENAISRLYGGIHYRFAIEKGIAMGNDIGNQVITKVKFTK